MSNHPLDQEDIKKVLANPYYAIKIDEDLTIDHEPIISEENWVKANAKLIKEIGAESWLTRLLEVLRAKK